MRPRFVLNAPSRKPRPVYGSSRRKRSLPAEVVFVLRAHKVKTLELRLKLEMGNIAPETFVFGAIEGELIRPRNLSKAWWRARGTLNLPAVSFHTFRHSHATVLIKAGVDIVTISRRLGTQFAYHAKHLWAPDRRCRPDAAAAKAIEGVLR
jgi:integrase